MTTEYEDDQHEMISEGDTPEELQDGMEDDAVEQERAAEAKKKKDKQFKMIVFGVASAGLLGVFGYKFMSGSPAPKQPVAINQPAASPTPAPMAPVAPAPIAMDPAGQVAMNPAGPVAMNPAGPVAMNPAGPVAMNPAGPVAMNPAGPVAVNPAGPVAVNPAGPVAVNPAGPVAVNPAGPVAVNPAGPVVMNPSPTATVAVESPEVKPASEGFNRGFDELAKKLDDFKEMFTKFDEMNIGDRLAKLEARVSALEGNPSNARATGGAGNVTAAKPRVRVYAKPAAKVVPIGEGEDLLFARINEPQRAQVPTSRVAVESTRAAAATPTRGYALSAVIPGRIWVKGGDGSSQTFETGEVLPDGAKILKIDPDRGDVTTSKGVLKFEQR